MISNDSVKIRRILKILGDDFALSNHPNARKGGSIGLAATAIGLGKVRFWNQNGVKWYSQTGPWQLKTWLIFIMISYEDCQSHTLLIYQLSFLNKIMCNIWKPQTLKMISLICICNSHRALLQKFSVLYLVEMSINWKNIRFISSLHFKIAKIHFNPFSAVIFWILNAALVHMTS